MSQAQRLPGTGLRNATRVLDIDLLLDWLAHPVRRAVGRPAERKWRRGESVCPPQSVKWKAIAHYARAFDLKVLVETGTYLGHTLYAHRKTFDMLHSIELSEALYENALRRFRRMPQVQLHLGDSARLLPRILADLHQPALFWLDGHYSAGVTAKGDKETPIREELAAIFDRWIDGHVVLIDDARAFTGTSDYPTLDQLQSLVESRGNGLSFTVADDIVRIAPALRS